jgi:hypothetical protein
MAHITTESPLTRKPAPVPSVEAWPNGRRHDLDMLHHRTFSAAMAALLLTSCASPTFDAGRTETVLPLNRAWFEGRKVEYVTTDISDLVMARALGVNYVPRLTDAIAAPGRRSVVERVYKFSGGEQISIFQSAPSPTGAGNADRSYSPLWRLVLVRWLRPAAVRELASEEQLLAAADRGEVAMDMTNIVVNCPITRSVDGLPLKGVR